MWGSAVSAGVHLSSCGETLRVAALAGAVVEVVEQLVAAVEHWPDSSS